MCQRPIWFFHDLYSTWVYLNLHTMGAKNFWTELNFFVQFVQFADLLQVNFWYAIKRLHVSTWRKLPSTYLKKWIPHRIMIVFVVLYTCGHGRIWKKSSCYCMVYDLHSGLAKGNFCEGVICTYNKNWQNIKNTQKMRSSWLTLPPR